MEERAATLQVVSDASNLMIRVINEVLDLTKLEAGQMKVHEEAFEPRAVVASLLRMAERYHARSANVQLLSDIDPAVPERLAGDRFKIEQILFNLLSNALKYTPLGHVLVRLRLVAAPPDPRLPSAPAHSQQQLLDQEPVQPMPAPPQPSGEAQAQVQVQAQAQAQTDTVLVQFEVHDTGTGIRPENMAKLFQMYGVLEEPTRQLHSAGTSLGLAISRSLCRLLGGELSASSEYGRGSVFSFCLPLRVLPPLEPARSSIDLLSSMPAASAPAAAAVAAEAAAGAAAGAGAGGKHLAGKRILVVDDNSTVRMLVARMLRREGAETLEAEDGLTALELLLHERENAKPVHAVLLDCIMPGRDGYWTRYLRSSMLCVRTCAYMCKNDLSVEQLGAPRARVLAADRGTDRLEHGGGPAALHQLGLRRVPRQASQVARSGRVPHPPHPLHRRPIPPAPCLFCLVCRAASFRCFLCRFPFLCIQCCPCSVAFYREFYCCCFFCFLFFLVLFLCNAFLLPLFVISAAQFRIASRLGGRAPERDTWLEKRKRARENKAARRYIAEPLLLLLLLLLLLHDVPSENGMNASLDLYVHCSVTGGGSSGPTSGSSLRGARCAGSTGAVAEGTEVPGGAAALARVPVAASRRSGGGG